MKSLLAEESKENSVVLYKKKRRAKNVLWHLYNYEARTIPQLAVDLHISIPSITEVMEQLTQENWVSSVGTATGNNGRRPTLFALEPERNYVVVVEISTHDVTITVVNPSHQNVYRRQATMYLEDSPVFVDMLLEYIRNVLHELPMPKEHVIAIGVSVPGLIDESSGLNLTYQSLNVAGVSFKDWLHHEFMIPVYIINDTKATVLGESRFGGGRGKQHILSINIDWGVGLGIILNGEVFQGASGYAGELGHIQMDPNGERCSCGKIGCLDTITSAPSVVRRIKKAVLEGKPSLVTQYTKSIDKLNIDQVLEAARQKDELVTAILHDTGILLGKGLAIAINILNPEIIIIDGILAQAAELLTKPIQEAIQTYCLGAFIQKIKVETTALEGNARWLGTHAFVMEHILAPH